MKKIALIVIFLIISNCSTVKNKTDEIVKKENEKLSQFIGKSSKELKIEMGIPNSEELSDTGKKIFVYKTKKYGIPCERKFEINNKETVVGFTSKGCF